MAQKGNPTIPLWGEQAWRVWAPVPRWWPVPFGWSSWCTRSEPASGRRWRGSAQWRRPPGWGRWRRRICPPRRRSSCRWSWGHPTWTWSTPASPGGRARESTADRRRPAKRERRPSGSETCRASTRWWSPRSSQLSPLERWWCGWWWSAGKLGGKRVVKCKVCVL